MSEKLVILCVLFSAVIGVMAATETSYPNLIYDFYVDATLDNIAPTDSERYPMLSDWAYDSNTSTSVIYDKWYLKGEVPSSASAVAMYGTAFQGCGEQLPQLTMTVDGLEASKSYNVYAVFWCRNDTEYWYGYAGLDGDVLWLCDNISEYDNIFDTSAIIKGTQLFLGQISGKTILNVNIDGPSINSAARRAWFDGLAFVETTPGPFKILDIQADITDPLGVAELGFDSSVIDSTPAIGQNQIAQGTRVRVTADLLAGNCPDIYDFIGLSGDVSTSSNTVDIKLDDDITIVAEYLVRDYTPVCGGDICHPLLAGDTDGDCKVDFDDLANITDNWLYSTKP